ncbi:MAG TPA: tRNA CCA-pyrophosphorylase, partial [bacterium]|nr:tRNA CCA-pyrophosphorylase [bacterium]
MELYKFLPKTNCKKCGKPTCMAFALDLLQGKVKVDDCTPLLELKFKKNYDT